MPALPRGKPVELIQSGGCHPLKHLRQPIQAHHLQPQPRGGQEVQPILAQAVGVEVGVGVVVCHLPGQLAVYLPSLPLMSCSRATLFTNAGALSRPSR
jgi:hypothetical protein